jgi:hypothetical protein
VPLDGHKGRLVGSLSFVQSLAGKLQKGRKADWILKAIGTVAAAPETIKA